MKLLIAAATEAEIAPTIRFLKENYEEPTSGVFQKKDIEIHVSITGVGLMATTFSLTKALLRGHYSYALQAGIGGAFNRDLPLGSLVLIENEQLGDLGAEDHTDFLSIFQLGFLAENEFPFEGKMLVNSFQNNPFNTSLPKAKSLTVHTVSGHAPTIEMRTKNFAADVESMEGAAFHYVCLQLGVPFLQLRAISNYVTPRDRSSWQIGKAIKSLNDQLIDWLQ